MKPRQEQPKAAPNCAISAHTRPKETPFMITAIRSLFGSTIGKILALGFVVLVGLAFALGDVSGTGGFGGVGGGNVAKVGKSSIGAGELRDRIRTAYDQARQNNPQLTMATFLESGAVDGVLDQIIETQALEQYAEELGFAVSKRMIDGQIADMPAFRGVSGTFDQSRFELVLRENNLSEMTFREELKQQLLARQLLGPIGNMTAIAGRMAQPYAALLMEKRQGSAAFIPASAFAPQTDPGDALLQKHLAAHKARFTMPEQRVVQYALFDRSMAPIAPVTDAEVAEFYKTNAAQFAANESRVFQQVTAPDQATAAKIAAQAKGGDLAAAARSAGLSVSTTGKVSQSEFAATSSSDAAQAAFAASNGAVLGPVKTSLGFAVIKVAAIEARPARTLAQANSDIRAELARNKANNAVVDFYNKLQDAVNGGASIQEVASDNKLTVITTPALLPNGQAPEQPDYRPAQELAVILPQAFQSGGEGDGHLATLVENEKFAVYSVKTIIAAAPPPFAKIRANILTDWRIGEGNKIARAKAEEIVKAVKAGKSLQDAMQLAGNKAGSVQTIGGSRAELGRNGQPVPQELALLFSMAEGSMKSAALPGDRGYMLVSLTKVDRPDPKAIEAERVKAVAAPLAPAFGNEQVDQLIAEAKRRIGVKIDQKQLDRLRQELTGANQSVE